MPTHLSCPPAHHAQHSWVGGVAYTHPPMNSSTTHPTMHPTTTRTTTHHPCHEPSNQPPYHHAPHEPSNHPTTTHPMNPPKYMHSDRVTLWICLMGGWVGVHKIKSFNIVAVHGWVSICTHLMNPPTTHPTTTHTNTHPPTI